MKTADAKAPAFALTIAAIIVCWLTFLPWGYLEGRGISSQTTIVQFSGMFGSGSIAIHGWTSAFRIGVTIPNALVPLAAVIVALMAWAKALAIWFPPWEALFLLALYGFVQIIGLLFRLFRAQDASPAVAGFLVALVFYWILRILVSHHKALTQPLALD